MNDIRKAFIEKRKEIKDREEKDRAVFLRFFEVLPDEAKRIFIYCSFSGETDTRMIISKLLEEGREVYLPVVTGKTSMDFYRLENLNELKSGSFGIPEPKTEGKTPGYPDPEKDLMVIPGTVFDECGGRLGYGGGFYDRYLERHPAHTLALAYEMQVTEEPLELEEHDKRMERLITDEKIRVWKE